jgi:hypothetical protein
MIATETGREGLQDSLYSCRPGCGSGAFSLSASGRPDVALQPYRDAAVIDVCLGAPGVHPLPETATCLADPDSITTTAQGANVGVDDLRCGLSVPCSSLELVAYRAAVSF